MSRADNVTNFYKTLKQYTDDYDVIGISYYPYYHGTLSTLNGVLNQLETTYPNKKIQIVETGYYHAWYPDDAKYKKSNFPNWPDTDAGQLQFTKDLIATLNQHTQVDGLYWWFPEANEYGLDWNTQRVTDKWYNASLFDNQTGRAMQALYELKNFAPNSAGISSVNVQKQADGYWYTLDGRRLSGEPTAKGLYIHGNKKVIKK
jgi:arabinogalactan endo-1,4-beta-galactosidase